MGLGILDDKKLNPVPGTATLEDLEGATEAAALGPNVKRNKDGIILEPQPSNDPNDPLNWPLWQRDLITSLLCLLSVLASTLSPLLAANTVTLINYFGGLSVTEAALLTGYHLMGVALSGFIFVATARVWGKRHLWVLAPLIIIASSIWGGCAGKNYKSLVAARVFQGVGLAPFEGLVNAAVGEMYFVHESGKRLALSNMCLFGGAFMTPVIVGRITLDMGWQWTFWFIAIFTAVLWPFVVLFVPETTFHRKSMINTSTAQLVQEEPLEMTEAAAGTSKAVRHFAALPDAKGGTLDHVESGYGASFEESDKDEGNIHHAMPRKMITRRNLAVFSGRKTSESFFLLCLRPFPLYFQPGILWACLIQGAMIAWTAVLGVCLALIMLGLSFNEAQTGYMYTGAFVGALLAFVLAGIISDPAARWMTKRNGGIFEPEFRMVLVIPMAAFGLTGLFAFGKTAGDSSYGWLPPDVFFGFVVAGMTFGAIAAAQYIVDGYREIAVEGFTCMLVFKNLIAFGMTYRSLDWYLALGTRDLFYIVGYVQVAVCLTTIPMYILGKKNRSFFARYDILKILRLQ